MGVSSNRSASQQNGLEVLLNIDRGTESRLEVHLFDFSGDLYGQELAVALHAFIREEQKFESFDALKAQIARDAHEARALLDRI